MKRILFTTIIASLLLVNAYLFRENRDLKNEVGGLKHEKENQKIVLDNISTNSRLLGLFFDGLFTQDENVVHQFSEAVQNSGNEETSGRYIEMVNSSSADALLGFGQYLNRKNIELCQE